MTWRFFETDVDPRMDDDFMQRLIGIRAEYDKPMRITSSYRVREDEIAKGRSGNSAHCTGRAVDVAVTGGDALELIRIALKHGITGVGVSQKGAGRFIHLDDLPGKEGQPRPWIWSY